MDLAAIFVSPILRYFIPKLITYCSNEIGLFWGVKGELKNLAQLLELIEAVLQDAENQQVQNRLVNLWLEKLKDVVYDAEDVFNEIQYEYLQRKMKNKMKIVSMALCCLPSKFDYQMARKIKDVNKKLDRITKDMEKFSFTSQFGGGNTCGSNITVMNEIRSETSSHINDSAAVVGRTDDRSKILNLLNQDDYSVVRITGMGGIGKTTLAQLVYDNTSDDTFVVKKWVSMYGKSKPKEIFLDLLELNAHSLSSLNAIKDSVKQKLSAGRCLIVLDDVWINRGIDINELLKDLLSMSSRGSKILMTMRSAEEIPPMTDCRYEIHQLQGLPEADCWSIIKKTAFAHGGAEETEDLINIGRQISIKCGGLPLAAKTLGGLLYSKKNVEDWLFILNNKIWNLPPTDDKIMSILKLSCDHLSLDVKRCFSYCSIFPKGHMFSKNELIRMWMAERFLSSHWQAKASPEAVGNEYFKILLLNSFFHDEQRNNLGDIKSFRMHDLVHDLAVSVAGRESLNITTDDVPNIDQSKIFRYLGLHVLDSDVSTAIPSATYKSFNILRTLVYSGAYGEGVWAKQIWNFGLLRRVLSLSSVGIWKLPQSVCELKHLRYLDISYTGISSFPSSFGQLYNLQTLRVKGWNYFKELPQDMRTLVGLEYLIFSNKSKLIAEMPRDLSRLSELKKLSVFVVGEEGKGSGIEELKHLNLLGGKLVIENLGRVTDGTQANLMGKKNLTHLEMKWNSQGWNDPDRVTKDSEVIHDLQPHPNLKKLAIFNFGGSEFPTWMRSASIHLPKLVYLTLDRCNLCDHLSGGQQFPNLKWLRILNFGGLRFPTWIMSTSIHLPNLVSVTLYRCNECQHFPALGGLQFLKYLFVDGFGGVERIGNEFCGSNDEEAVSFPCLVQLHVYNYSNLEEPFRNLSLSEELEIQNYSKLSTTSTEFPSLRQLCFHIERRVDANLKSLSPKLLWGVLQTLLVTGCNNFVGFLPDNDEEQQHHHQKHNLSNRHLSKLEILRCHSLTVLPADFRGLNSLTYLAIEECSSLQSLPDGIQSLPALETLIIGGFSEDLIAFPFPEASSSDVQKYFVSLRVLKISGWPTLRSELPDQLQLLTSLQSFTIRGFPCLSSLPEWFGELYSLENLEIQNCSSLEYLPSEEQMQRLTSLKILNIGNCQLLLERNQFHSERWHKIEHILTDNGSSTSPLDLIPRNPDMYVELLSRRRSGIFSNQNKEKCWIDSCGRNCFMLFPRSFNITWDDDTRYWIWHSITEPSAASNDAEIEVPELIAVCHLNVDWVLDMSKLSPGVNYEVVFIFMLRERSYGWDKPVRFRLVLPDGQRLVQEVVLQTMPKSEWIEIHVGDFETPQQLGDQEKQVKFNLYKGANWKSGLVIEGAIVRPKK